METSKLKADILSAISEELDLWLEKEKTIKEGYEYETELIDSARKISGILLSKSIGTVSSNRNKKNSGRVLANSK